ncbi:MAG TPA: N-acetyltransferase [Thermoplasmatales archaeon]|nr:N-acetyltransferase [Thermoplasmatales archaeon]
MREKETYPYKYIKTIRLKDGTIVKLRPIKPEDEPLMLELFKTFSPETIKFRFFLPLREITHEDLVRYCNVDYKNEIAIVAEIKKRGNKKCLIGVARLIRDQDEKNRAEFAVVVGDPWQGKGLGMKITEYIMNIAKDMGISELYSRVLKNNMRSLLLSKKLGFEREDIGLEYLINKIIG